MVLVGAFFHCEVLIRLFVEKVCLKNRSVGAHHFVFCLISLVTWFFCCWKTGKVSRWESEWKMDCSADKGFIHTATDRSTDGISNCDQQCLASRDLTSHTWWHFHLPNLASNMLMNTERCGDPNNKCIRLYICEEASKKKKRSHAESFSNSATILPLWCCVWWNDERGNVAQHVSCWQKAQKIFSFDFISSCLQDMIYVSSPSA